MKFWINTTGLSGLRL